MYDLKASQMNGQRSIIQDFMNHKFQPAKNICCEKGEGVVDHSTVTKYLSVGNYVDDQASSSW